MADTHLFGLSQSIVTLGGRHHHEFRAPNEKTKP